MHQTPELTAPRSPFRFLRLPLPQQGRPFSWQEAHIALACILQKFDMTMHDPGYSLALKQTLTLKPKDFYVHAVPRNRSMSPIAVAPTSTLVGLPRVSKAQEKEDKEGQEGTVNVEPKQKLYVAYGSNTGTSQTFAQRIASDATAHGAFTASRSRA